MTHHAFTNRNAPFDRGAALRPMQENHKALKSHPAPYLSPVSPYRSVQLILSPLSLYQWPEKKDQNSPKLSLSKGGSKIEKKTHFKELGNTNLIN